MTEYSNEELLAAVFEDRWPREVNIWRLNTRLNLAPWWPPLPVVWARRKIGPHPGWRGTAYAQAWPKALALVLDLHRQYAESNLSHPDQESTDDR